MRTDIFLIWSHMTEKNRFSLKKRLLVPCSTPVVCKSCLWICPHFLFRQSPKMFCRRCLKTTSWKTCESFHVERRCLINLLVDLLVDWLVGWLVGWLIDWLMVDWLMFDFKDWLAKSSSGLDSPTWKPSLNQWAVFHGISRVSSKISLGPRIPWHSKPRGLPPTGWIFYFGHWTHSGYPMKYGRGWNWKSTQSRSVLRWSTVETRVRYNHWAYGKGWPWTP
jgi:hypothetical protein